MRPWLIPDRDQHSGLTGELEQTPGEASAKLY